MSDFEQTEVMYFVHHFPTHSTVWEVGETSGYPNLAEACLIYSGAFEAIDGSIYMSYEPVMMRRERADKYVRVEDNCFIRYTVIEIS